MNEQDRRKRAEKRKKESENKLSELGLSLNSELFSVGIIFENLLNSQSNIKLLNDINGIFNNFVGIDINVFSHNMGPCCVFLLSPILDLKYIFSWTYPLIVVNQSTLQTALNSRSRNIYCCFQYNNLESDPRINVVDDLNLVEIIKIIVRDLKNEEK